MGKVKESIYAGVVKILKTDDIRDYYFICNDCNKKFDGKDVEEFVRHTIDENHPNWDKCRKIKSYL